MQDFKHRITDAGRVSRNTSVVLPTAGVTCVKHVTDVTQDVEKEMDRSFKWKALFTEMQSPMPILMALDMVCPERQDKIMHEIENLLEKEFTANKLSEEQQRDLRNVGHAFRLQSTRFHNLSGFNNQKIDKFRKSYCGCCRCSHSGECPDRVDLKNCNCVCKYHEDIVNASKEVQIWHSNDPETQYNFVCKSVIATDAQLCIWLHHILDTIESDGKANYVLLSTSIKRDLFGNDGIKNPKQAKQFYEDLAQCNYGHVVRAELITKSIIGFPFNELQTSDKVQDSLFDRVPKYSMFLFGHYFNKEKLDLAVQEYTLSAKPNEKYKPSYMGGNDETDDLRLVEMEIDGYQLAYYKIAKLYEHFRDHKKAYEYHTLSATKFKNKESAMYCVDVLLPLKKSFDYHTNCCQAVELLELVIGTKYNLDETTLRLLDIYTQVVKEKIYIEDVPFDARFTGLYKHKVQRSIDAIHVALKDQGHLKSIHYWMDDYAERIKSGQLDDLSLKLHLEYFYDFALAGAKAGDAKCQYELAIHLFKSDERKLALNWLSKAVDGRYAPAIEKHSDLLLQHYETAETKPEKSDLLHTVCKHLETIPEHERTSYASLLLDIKPRKKYSPDHYNMMKRVVEYIKQADLSVDESTSFEDQQHATKSMVAIGYQFGLDYKHGKNGAKKNLESSIDWLFQSAGNLHGPSIRELIHYYEHVDKNPVEAWDWSELLRHVNTDLDEATD